MSKSLIYYALWTIRISWHMLFLCNYLMIKSGIHIRIKSIRSDSWRIRKWASVIESLGKDLYCVSVSYLIDSKEHFLFNCAKILYMWYFLDNVSQTITDKLIKILNVRIKFCKNNICQFAYLSTKLMSICGLQGFHFYKVRAVIWHTARFYYGANLRKNLCWIGIIITFLVSLHILLEKPNLWLE